jgi:hypothetical protein
LQGVVIKPLKDKFLKKSKQHIFEWLYEIGHIPVHDNIKAQA